MTEPKAPAPRPVSFLAVGAILVLLSLFGLLTVRVYTHHRPAAPQNEEPQNLSKDLAWKATPELRRNALDKLRASQAYQAENYGWVDEKAGVVRLPIERAMELVVLEHHGKWP
ncbi:MAG: hypothetical protein ABSF76_12750 [Opitutaceae bacterium]|jgi:hypothetical protein